MEQRLGLLLRVEWQFSNHPARLAAMVTNPPQEHCKRLNETRFNRGERVMEVL